MIDLSNLPQIVQTQTGQKGVNTETPTGVVDLSKLPQGGAAYYSGEDWNKFMTDYGPLLERQLASLDDQSLVKTAERDAKVVPGLAIKAADRAAMRRGGYTLPQFASLYKTRNVNAATQTADILNNARMDQRNRNLDTAYKYSQLGTDIYQMGLDNVRESEGLATQRRMNNQAAKQAHKQNLMGLGMTTLAAFAL